MARALDLTQRQVRALCEGAKKAGYVPVIEFGNTVVRLIPEEHISEETARQPVDEEEEAAL